MTFLMLLESVDPTTLVMWIGAVIIVLMVGVISVLLWPDAKPEVRTYQEHHVVRFSRRSRP